MAEVQFSTWTADNLVRQASFKGLREDKKPAEVRREVPDASLTKKADPPKKAAAPAPKKLGFRVTHPEKIVDPETGLTKQALVDYYLAVAPLMLPHVTGRPLSLVRCPNGTGKKCFYQKHLGPGMPPGIDGVEIPDRKGKGVETYVTVQGEESLAGLAQMNVLEIHPWGSTNDDLEHPDRIIFDLDPDEAVPWPTLCESAVEVRERLQKLGLQSFVKTTGGKGLHVVAPIRPKFDWEKIKAFTHAFTLQMEQDNSKLYISKMTKAARTNKIFVDYLRNEWEATAVAPYSSRARLGMAAALPLEWAELKSAKRPKFLFSDLMSGGIGCVRIRGKLCCRLSRRFQRSFLRLRNRRFGRFSKGYRWASPVFFGRRYAGANCAPVDCPPACLACLVNAEIHFDVDFHWHWFPLQGGGLEFILLHRFDCFFIQTHAQVAHYLNPLRIALRVDNQRDDANTLILCAARLVGKLRIRREHQLRSRNAATHVVESAAVAAAFTRTIAVSLARTDAATRAGTHARSAAAAVGSRTDDAGPWDLPGWAGCYWATGYPWAS